jgi:hypothetical protein
MRVRFSCRFNAPSRKMETFFMLQPPLGLQKQLSQRFFHATSPILVDHYKALNVSKSATEKEIKIAYFRTAKKYHPDTMRGASKAEQDAAKIKWQEAANSYEILSDAKKRAAYDANSDSSNFYGGFGGSNSQYQGQQQQQQQQANAQQTWSTVTSDADILEEALNEYIEEVQENIAAAAAGAAEGDLEPTWNFLKRHKGLVATVVLPTFLIFRFPAPVIAALRFIPQIGAFLLMIIVRMGTRNSIVLMRTLFRFLWPVLAEGVGSASKRAQAYTAARRAMKADKTKGASGGRKQRTSAQEEARRNAKDRKNKNKSKAGGRRSRHV